MVRVWRVNRVASALAADTVSELEKMQYLLSSTMLKLLIAIAATLGASHASNVPRPWRAELGGAMAFVTCVGLVMAFAANKGTQGRRFVERYVCLELPLFIRTATLGLAGYLVASLVLFSTSRAWWVQAVVEARPGVVLAVDGYWVLVVTVFWIGMYRAMSRAAAA